MEKEIKMEIEPLKIYQEGGAVNSVNGQTGDVVLTTSDLENTSDYQNSTEVDSAISTAIGLEATARQNADNGLQGQIDALAASSDVTDIVGTYADLEAYDTSKLKDNDIIKVLQDESQNDETTYYRWSTSTESFTLIGEEGPYYTKAQTNTLLAGKLSDAQIRNQSIVTDGVAKIPVASGRYDEDKAGVVGVATGNGVNISSGNLYLEKADNNLIAGKTNNYRAIVPGNLDYAIEKGLGNNSLSWTDTEKSNARTTIGAASTASFTGTDGVDAGTAGLVPAPATTDAGKFLKADGTWDSAGGGSGDTVYSTKTTSDSDTGGAVYIGNLGTDQTEVEDPTTTDNHYKYFWALPMENSTVPSRRTINIGGSIFGGCNNNDNLVIGTGTIAEGGAWNCTGNMILAPFYNSSSRAMLANNERTTDSIIIGRGQINGGQANVAIGHSTTVRTGDQTLSSTKSGIAIGAGSTCLNPNSIAIGVYSETSRSGEFNIGASGNGGGWGYNSSDYRILAGVYDGQQAHDAATYGQVISYSAINGAGAPTTATEGKYVGQLYYDTTNEAMYFLKTIDTTTTPATYTWEALGGGGGGGGGATKLTSADYNYKYGSGDPDGIAPWLLDEGMYVFEDGIMVYKNYASMASTTGNGLIVMAKPTSTHKGLFILSYPDQRPELTYNIDEAGMFGTTLPFPVLVTNTLTSTSTTNALSAKQGKALKDMIDEIVPQTNTLSTSAPTTSTVGVLGQLYTDTTNMHTYQCTAISGSTYTWTQRW